MHISILLCIIFFDSAAAVAVAVAVASLIRVAGNCAAAAAAVETVAAECLPPQRRLYRCCAFAATVQGILHQPCPECNPPLVYLFYHENQSSRNYTTAAARHCL